MKITIYDLFGEIQKMMCDTKRDHLLDVDIAKELYLSHLQIAVDVQELHPARFMELQYLAKKATEDFIERFK